MGLTLRRLHMAMFAGAVILGALVGGTLSLLRPPMVSSVVTVIVPVGKPHIWTQALIADSDPVLIAASRNGPLSLNQLLHQVHVTVASSGVLAITVEANTAADAQGAANAVARSYVEFVSSPNAPGGQVLAKVVSPAMPSTGSSSSRSPTWVAVFASTGSSTSPTWVAGFAALGALAGAGCMIMWRPVLPR